jgi:hypothetical protein
MSPAKSARLGHRLSIAGKANMTHSTVPFAQIDDNTSSSPGYAWSRNDIPEQLSSHLAPTGGLGDQPTPGARLAWLRHRYGFGSAAEAARALGMNETTFQHHENGTRIIPLKAAQRYASYFGVEPEAILFGIIDQSTQPKRRPVQVMGVVEGAGDVIDRMMHAHSLPETIPDPRRPEDADAPLLALFVASHQMHPAYRPGNVVYYQALELRFDPTEVQGEDCVVETEEGEQFLCVPYSSGRGQWTLQFYNAPVQTGVRLRRAARVELVQKRHPATAGMFAN